MAKRSDTGLKSSAGLMRYYEIDKNAVHIQQKSADCLHHYRQSNIILKCCEWFLATITISWAGFT